MRFRFLIMVFLGFYLTACGGQSGGLAPSHDVVPVNPADQSGDSNFKYGETVTTGNAWEISIDTTDPVESKTLSNGWSVEVKYE